MLTKESSDDKPLEIYKMNKTYQELIKRKYKIKDPHLLYDEKILLLIYTVEWFNIPDYKLYDKICFHPLITKRHYKKLNDIYENHKNNLILITFFFYGFLYLLKKTFAKASNTRRNYKIIFPFALLAIIQPYLTWEFILKRKMNKDIGEDQNLINYLKLDFDKEKIKNDLLNYNIVL